MRHPLHDSDSIADSLDDVQVTNSTDILRHSPTFEMPSQHSGFRSSSVAESLHSYNEGSMASSASAWSPPAWRNTRYNRFHGDDPLAPSPVLRGLSNPPETRGSRETSPQDVPDSARSSVEPDPYLRAAIRIPLPATPDKYRGMTPASDFEGEQEDDQEHEVPEINEVQEATPKQSNCELLIVPRKNVVGLCSRDGFIQTFDFPFELTSNIGLIQSKP